MFSLLLEMEPLVFLNLIRLEGQFQKPQNQFGKLSLKILFLWNKASPGSLEAGHGS